MDRKLILDITGAFSDNSPTNYLSPAAKSEAELNELANKFHANNFSRNNVLSGASPEEFDRDKTSEYVGLRFYLHPIMAIGRADDPGFIELQKEGVVGPHHKLPTDWLPEAKSVISLFLPFSQRVITSNTKDPVQPSWEWLFTRVDGQQHLLATGALVKEALEKEGYHAVVPQTDDRYFMRVSPDQTELPIPTWSSNWSERHVGYVTGLGTFGRMTNFISELGACGRLVSIVTDWETEPDVKKYSGIYDYCADCGACYRACPAGALSKDGKDMKKCSQFLHDNCKQYAPRYGCGKCQSGIPCQTSCFKK